MIVLRHPSPLLPNSGMGGKREEGLDVFFGFPFSFTPTSNPSNLLLTLCSESTIFHLFHCPQASHHHVSPRLRQQVLTRLPASTLDHPQSFLHVDYKASKCKMKIRSELFLTQNPSHASDPAFKHVLSYVTRLLASSPVSLLISLSLAHSFLIALAFLIRSSSRGSHACDSSLDVCVPCSFIAGFAHMTPSHPIQGATLLHPHPSPLSLLATTLLSSGNRHYLRV